MNPYLMMQIKWCSNTNGKDSTSQGAYVLGYCKQFQKDGPTTAKFSIIFNLFWNLQQTTAKFSDIFNLFWNLQQTFIPQADNLTRRSFITNVILCINVCTPKCGYAIGLIKNILTYLLMSQLTVKAIPLKLLLSLHWIT